MPRSPRTLILGGARSGKSRHAEALVLEAARATDTKPVYIATYRPWGDDPEMDDRILRHQMRRGTAWDLVEAPVTLPDTLAAHADRPVLVDCLTLWLTNLLLDEAGIEGQIGRLLAALETRGVPAVLVANEVGLGLVPETPLGRRFRDEAGRLNQRVAAACERVVFIAAGLPLTLKDQGRA
ncbi:bifunctional adenosylcobinamide kinase/adenosylcobinamide-phosphate guanylyltransferase [Rhodospira trueperi]|uniref:Bifunctional adenosylcobalamin biosynthesis protein n=1 Tax=Rhodospira trueperi TaxID=69960 RepID=A0A1G7ECR0_9PROT|nr:bifunctional adenosylcobinamide kinase/adenosylcobinamide-phosphate guanylyltransferase [Rhodospira trueperi]SDE61441.1 adenosylcobinamide kinase / adenosylcobinamide-phosphate guanylyltransferase [Rhodospira trueperi]